jgi:hypothetical protein
VLSESDVSRSPVWRIFLPSLFPCFLIIFCDFRLGPRPDLCFLHLYEHVQHTSKYLHFQKRFSYREGWENVALKLNHRGRNN